MGTETWWTHATYARHVIVPRIAQGMWGSIQPAQENAYGARMLWQVPERNIRCQVAAHRPPACTMLHHSLTTSITASVVWAVLNSVCTADCDE